MPRTWPPIAAALLGLVALIPARGDDIRLIPETARLVGPRSSQRLLVERMAAGIPAGDAPGAATFAVDDARVAGVGPDGVVIPKGNGVATVTATVDGRHATAIVSVEDFDRAEPPSFRLDVLPVLARAGCNQGSCHGAAAGKGGFKLTLRGYGPELDHDVITRQALGRRIVRTAPAESLLLLKPTGAIEHGGGARFGVDSPEYRILAAWIAAGTPGPSPTDPTYVAVEAEPAAATLAPGGSQSILVRATDSVGRPSDVTRLAKFASTDESVAKVDESGRVRIEGPGEVAVTVWFAGRVSRTTLTVPYPDAAVPASSAPVASHNPIDERNLAKLRSLHIRPSADAGDAAFLRRAYLDATGTLPPAEAVLPFLDDPDPARRAKLVDRLLASPEFVDYWTYKWSDLLLVSTQKLAVPAMWSFQRFIRAAVAADMPWDEFARRIVTAKGRTLEHGAANYFVLHRDPIDLTESAGMAFLGVSMTCARCHDHPLEKWTQTQYYGLANLFARVKLKDGPTEGDVVVSAEPEGDIRHPRTGLPVPPAPLDAEALPIEARGDRREAFAAWLARPDNPYFDRAIVNRVWANFFGRGLVDPEDDLRATNPASDEPLMAWLVEDFRAHGRSIRHLARTIMNSAVYARSSAPPPGPDVDPKFLASYPARRLPAEVLLDALARVTGVPTPFKGYPAGWRSLQLPDSKVENAFLASFGRPIRESTCSCERSSEPSVSQALHLANGATINEKLRSDSGEVARLIAAGRSDDAIVEHLSLAAHGRRPSDAERARLVGVLAGSVAGLTDPAAAALARRQAVEDLFWAALSGNEFMFNH